MSSIYFINKQNALLLVHNTAG